MVDGTERRREVVGQRGGGKGVEAEDFLVDLKEVVDGPTAGNVDNLARL